MRCVLEFELFKVCGNSEPLSCGIWAFARMLGGIVGVFNNNALDIKSFRFIFCDWTVLSKWCEYFIKVTPLKLPTSRSSLTVGRIAALAQEG